MKKIEEVFLKDFDDSLNNKKSFDDIKSKINIERFEKKKTSIFSPIAIRNLKFISVFAMFFAIAIPSSILIFKDGNHDTTSEPTNDNKPGHEEESFAGLYPSAPGAGADESQSYSITKIASSKFYEIDTFDISSITIMKSLSDKGMLINELLSNGLDEIYPDLLDKLSNLKYDQIFFEKNALVFCPFVYSSSEKNIDFTRFSVNSKNNSFTLFFDIYSPENMDSDLLIDFYALEINKGIISSLDDPICKIQVFNTFDNSNHSAYYGISEEDK